VLDTGPSGCHIGSEPTARREMQMKVSTVVCRIVPAKIDNPVKEVPKLPKFRKRPVAYADADLKRFFGACEDWEKAFFSSLSRLDFAEANSRRSNGPTSTSRAGDSTFAPNRNTASSQRTGRNVRFRSRGKWPRCSGNTNGQKIARSCSLRLSMPVSSQAPASCTTSARMWLSANHHPM
jgi:hypothetical protein